MNNALSTPPLTESSELLDNSVRSILVWLASKANANPKEVPQDKLSEIYAYTRLLSDKRDDVVANLFASQEENMALIAKILYGAVAETDFYPTHKKIFDLLNKNFLRRNRIEPEPFYEKSMYLALINEFFKEEPGPYLFACMVLAIMVKITANYHFCDTFQQTVKSKGEFERIKKYVEATLKKYKRPSELDDIEDEIYRAFEKTYAGEWNNYYGVGIKEKFPSIVLSIRNNLMSAQKNAGYYEVRFEAFALSQQTYDKPLNEDPEMAWLEHMLADTEMVINTLLEGKVNVSNRNFKKVCNAVEGKANWRLVFCVYKAFLPSQGSQDWRDTVFELLWCNRERFSGFDFAVEQVSQRDFSIALEKDVYTKSGRLYLRNFDGDINLVAVNEELTKVMHNLNCTTMDVSLSAVSGAQQ